MTKGMTRWRTLPDSERFIVLLEYFDGVQWLPMPAPKNSIIYPSNVAPPDEQTA